MRFLWRSILEQRNKKTVDDEDEFNNKVMNTKIENQRQRRKGQKP